MNFPRKHIFAGSILYISIQAMSYISASGLESKGIGARSRGMGFAMVAVCDEWSSVYYNPAAISMNTESVFGIEYEYFTGSINSSKSLRNLSVTEAQVAQGDFIDFIGDEPAFFRKKSIDSSIHFFAMGIIFRKKQLSYGIGIYGSGSGTAWEDRVFSASQDLIEAEVSYINGALNIPLVISYRLTPVLSLGISMRINWGLLKYTSEKKRSGNSPYLLKSVQDTDGVGYSNDIGFFWKATDNLDLGLVFKLPYTFKKSGETYVEQSLVSLAAKSDTSVYMYYPLRVSIGSNWRLNSRDSLAASLTWLNWSNYNMKIQYKDKIPGLFDDYDGNPSDWMDTIVVNLGFEHNLSREWKLRCGITYDQAPEPKEKRTLIGGQVIDTFLFSAGAGVNVGKAEINFGYIYTYGPEVDGFIPEAKYSMSLHELFLGTALKF